MAEGEGESRIWNNFRISGLSDCVSEGAIQQDGNTVERAKFMGKGDESSLCQV